MEKIVIYLLMVLKFINLKQKTIKLMEFPLCLWNISKNFSADIMKKTGPYGHVYDFSIVTDDIAVCDLLDIHKCLMKKHDIV